MRRLFPAVALTAVTLAVLPGMTGCKKEEAKKPESAAPAEPKAADTAAAAPTPPAAAAPGEPGAAATPVAPPPPPLDPGKRPDSVKDEHLAIADKIVETTTKFANEMGAAKSDCKAATQIMKTKGKAVKDVMGEAEKLQTQLRSDPAAMQWFQRTYGPKMMGAISTLGSVIGQCRTDKDFEAAFRELGLGGRPPPPRGGMVHGGDPPIAAPPAPPKAPDAEPKKDEPKK